MPCYSEIESLLTPKAPEKTLPAAFIMILRHLDPAITSHEVLTEKVVVNESVIAGKPSVPPERPGDWKLREQTTGLF
ncbi:MAG: hypothetical protein GWO24_15035 [Akkermansiaceae bacterium]|nr:hypothetical protein [Akkermansiaceae bacterium]